MARILIVDDAAFMRMVIRNMLEKNGYEVVGEADNGQKAFFKYKELNPDIVLMDITMPEVDGQEGLEMIMKYDTKAKVIMCSAMGQKSMICESINIGARDFVIKPFQEHRVMEAIEKVLKI